jgi:hypothetical protein
MIKLKERRRCAPYIRVLYTEFTGDSETMNKLRTACLWARVMSSGCAEYAGSLLHPQP